MEPITQIGEIGIYAGGECYVLRPTLRAISSLGEPDEIVEVFARVYGPADSFQDYAALGVLWACADGFDPAEVIGYADGEAACELRMGYVKREHLVPLARDLLKHGIVGDVKARSAGEESSGVERFEAREYAALAVAHLSLSDAEAWDMTMTSLVMALRAKFPDSQRAEAGANAPTSKELDDMLEWFGDVDKARKQGALH